MLELIDPGGGAMEAAQMGRDRGDLEGVVEAVLDDHRVAIGGKAGDAILA